MEGSGKVKRRSEHDDTHRGLTKRGRGRWSDGALRLLTLASVVSSVILVGGFAYGTFAALGGRVGSFRTTTAMDGPNGTVAVNDRASARTVNPHQTVHLVGLGDSLTHGLGDMSGRGYVGDVTQRLRQHGYKVIESNLGIDGLTSNRFMAELNQVSVERLVHSADVILISIGGNDLNDAAGLPNIDMNRIAVAKTNYAANLRTILSKIRLLNHSAVVFLVGLYNPYEDVSSMAHDTDSIVQAWDLRQEQIAAQFPRVIVAQTFDLFQLGGAQFLYIDHFHPNQAGYQRIADRIWQDLQGLFH